MKFFEDNPHVDVVGTQIRTLDTEGRVEELGTFGKKVKYATTDNDMKIAMMIGQNPLCHPSVVFRRRVVLKVGGYYDLWHLAEDFELWCKLVPYAKFANIDEVLIDYTQTVREDYDPNTVILLSDMYYHYHNNYCDHQYH